MALSNAQKQERWRKRNLIALSWDAREIVRRLATMEDQPKLALIVALLNQRLNPKDGRCQWVKDDGGRRGSIPRGRKDEVGDCVARAIAIATEKPYREVHDALIATAVRVAAEGKGDWAKWAKRKGRFRAFHADHGVPTEVSDIYLAALGWKYTSTKKLPRGKGIRLRADELPGGRLIVDLRRHYTAVIDGVIHDTQDCSEEGRRRIRGYWSKPPRSVAARSGASGSGGRSSPRSMARSIRSTKRRSILNSCARL